MRKLSADYARVQSHSDSLDIATHAPGYARHYARAHARSLAMEGAGHSQYPEAPLLPLAPAIWDWGPRPRGLENKPYPGTCQECPLADILTVVSPHAPHADPMHPFMLEGGRLVTIGGSI